MVWDNMVPVGPNGAGPWQRDRDGSNDCRVAIARSAVRDGGGAGRRCSAGTKVGAMEWSGRPDGYSAGRFSAGRKFTAGGAIRSRSWEPTLFSAGQRRG